MIIRQSNSSRHVYIIAVDIHVAYIVEINIKSVTVPVGHLIVRGGGGSQGTYLNKANQHH